MNPIIYIISYILSFTIILGWLLAQEFAMFPRENPCQRKESIGTTIFFAMFLATVGPIGVLVAWLITGFGCYGWTLKIK